MGQESAIVDMEEKIQMTVESQQEILNEEKPAHVWSEANPEDPPARVKFVNTGPFTLHEMFKPRPEILRKRLK